MTLKIGSIVSHSAGLGWGTGKVVEVTPTWANIEFSDGQNRKIAASFYFTLEPAAPGSFVPHVEVPVEVKPPRAPRATKKKVVSP